GILHRDMKPQNVMVLPNGVVKLMDFGISSVAGGSEADDDLVVGTPSYMSPEQAAGLPLDARSDLYAVGTVMFEMFTGTKPFQGSPSTAIIEKRKTTEPPRPIQFRADLPDTLESIILACLARSPDDRPANANKVYASLMRVVVRD